jgi:hypothetical protein
MQPKGRLGSGGIILTTKADSRSTKGKRAVQPEDKLPAWAVRELRAVSAKTGISFKKLLSAALGFGVYHLKEELGPTANLLASAEQMAKLDPNETLDNERPVEKPVQREADCPMAPEPGVGIPVVADEGFTEPRSERGTQTHSDDAGQRRAEHGAGESHNDFVHALTTGVGINEPAN